MLKVKLRRTKMMADDETTERNIKIGFVENGLFALLTLNVYYCVTVIRRKDRPRSPFRAPDFGTIVVFDMI